MSRKSKLKKQQTAFIMIGHVGVGKSTWAKFKTSTSHNLIRISKDDIRAMINGRYEYVEELEELVKSMAQRSMLAALHSGFDVVLDECHLTRKIRHDICITLKTVFPDIKIVYVYVHCNISMAMGRRKQDPMGHPPLYWEFISKTHQAVFQEPTSDEEFVDEMMEIYNEQ
jgi:predicted kinase